MFASFVIVIREGLEIALILAIILGFLRRTNRKELCKNVYRGALYAGAACVAASFLLWSLLGGVDEETMEFLEGVTMVAAGGILTWMIFWMRKHASSIKTTLETRAAAAATGATMALFAATAVAREGIETTLFLFGVAAQGVKVSSIVLGAFAGAAVVFVLGRMMITQSRRINLKRWFSITGFALVLIAGNSIVYGLHEFREWSGAEGLLAAKLWNIESGVLAEGPLKELLGMFGWAPHPEWWRVALFVGYVVTMMLILRWGSPDAGGGGRVAGMTGVADNVDFPRPMRRGLSKAASLHPRSASLLKVSTPSFSGAKGGVNRAPADAPSFPRFIVESEK